MENQRLMLAALLSVAILVIWQVLFPPPPPVDRSADPQTLEAPDTLVEPELDAPAAVRGESSPTSSEGDAAQTSTDATAAVVIEPIIADAEREVSVETPHMAATFTNRGAQLLSYRVKKQLDEDGQPFELVRYRGTDLHPFALVFGDRGSRLNSALFTVEERQDEGRPVLHFRHASEEKGVAEKIFTWDDDGFMQVDVRVEDEGWGLLLGPSLGNEKGRSGYTQFLDHAVGYLRQDELETFKAKDLEEDQILPRGSFDWVALENNYFLVAALPVDGLEAARVRPVLQREEIEDGKPRYLPVDTSSSEELEPEMLVIMEAEDNELQLSTYFGSKDYRDLSALPHGLERTVRWGDWLGVLVKPLYLILGWIYANVISNYGWAIMLVTLLIRLVFFPLTHKSQKSMTKMQQLNPKVQAIRSKYRPKMRDKQGRPNVEAQRQMNEEVMAVYKSAGVNPAAGCLPILLQMPVFFAFYRLLTNSVELRGADWILWIHDLSSPDPYFILPLLMGATSLLVQKMTPAPPDPMQRRIMQMMPIMFTAFAFYFPSGLVVYWMTNNVLTMGQQSLINRMKES